MATLASQPPHLPLPPPPIEVRCAGCDETLEVEPGLTEFICPDCQTPQALPPELLPRKRKALPLPRGGDTGKTQLPCACCNALLNVPHGLSRFSCPKCGAELAVDNERLKGYLARYSVAAPACEVTAVAPAAVRLPRPLEVEPLMLVWYSFRFMFDDDAEFGCLGN